MRTYPRASRGVQTTEKTMIYLVSAILFSSVVTSEAFLSSGWSKVLLARRNGIEQMASNADPWFPDAVAKNQVDMGVLE